MDLSDDLLEVDGGNDNVTYIRNRPEQPSVLGVDDLQLYIPRNVEQARDVLDKYAKLDVPRENVEFFKQHLFVRRDSWFVEVGHVGLIYLTNIVPTFTANFQVIFWDRKFPKERRELVRRVIATGFGEFALRRVGAFIPITNIPLVEVALPKIGFTREGTLRKAWRDEEDCDMAVFGLLKDEASEWEPIPHLHTEVE